MKNLGRKVYRFLGSLQLAVVIILGLATISAVGTFTEAEYNTETAQKLVYHSWYMMGLMIFLVINLVISALHRWPWQRRHIGFVVAHVGIIILLFGSYITQKDGLDGSISFGIGESNRLVTVSEYEIAVYVPVSNGEYMPFVKRDVDFLVKPPQTTPFEMTLNKEKNEVLNVIDFYPYTSQKTQIEPSTGKSDGPAARFQITSSRGINLTEWIQESGPGTGVLNLGPARIVIAQKNVEPSGENEVILKPTGDDEVNYTVNFKRKDGAPKKGHLKIGESMQTGWMDMKFRLLNFYPHAKMTSEFKKLDRPTGQSISAVKIKIAGQEHWIGLDSMVKIYTSDSMYVVTYGHKRIDIGFNMTLKDFQIGRDPGTNKAATYESTVNVDDLGERHISMNEPLVHHHYTFYQASFQEDPSGKASTSVLSVNYDPGRWLKYLGCLLIVSGSIIMFYFRKLLLKRSPHAPSSQKAS